MYIFYFKKKMTKKDDKERRKYGYHKDTDSLILVRSFYLFPIFDMICTIVPKKLFAKSIFSHCAATRRRRRAYIIAYVVIPSARASSATWRAHSLQRARFQCRPRPIFAVKSSPPPTRVSPSPLPAPLSPTGSATLHYGGEKPLVNSGSQVGYTEVSFFLATFEVFWRPFCDVSYNYDLSDQVS